MSAGPVVGLVLSKLDGVRRSGGQWSARCPAHDDRTNSLSVGEGDDGRVLLNCKAGCPTDAVLAAAQLVMADLFPREAGTDATKRKIERTYAYVDERGELLFEVVRFRPKAFRQRRPDGRGGWEWKTAGVRKVLYRLPAVIDAVTVGDTVFVVEGEKDVEALEQQGYVATCNPEGAGSWRDEYAEPFRDAKDVRVVADRDEPGREHARKVAASLRGVRATVHLYEPAHGKDVAEHLGAGFGVADLAWIDEDTEAPGAAVEPMDAARAATVIVRDDLFRRYSMGELLDEDASFRWRICGFMSQPTYGMVAGEQKTLKTYIDIFINIAVASGERLFGQFDVDNPGPVVAYIGEGGKIPYRRRLERVAAAMGVSLRDIPLVCSFDTAAVQSERFKDSLRRDLDELQPALVSLDPLYAFHGAATDAKNLHEEGALLNSLSGPCVDAGACLKVVNHFNQSGTGTGLKRITMAGGAEWCDSWWIVSHREDPDVANGRFFLALEVGSRQWGGSSWELDLEVGRFDPDVGEFDGTITWDLRRQTGNPRENDAARVLRFLDAHPFECTKEEIVKAIGGKAERLRKVIQRLDDDRKIRAENVEFTDSLGRPRKKWVFGPSSPDGTAGTSEAAA